MQKIREILLYEHIGAIAIGFIFAQAVSSIIAVFVRPVAFYLQTRGSEYVRFGESPHYSWEQSAPALISAVLLFIVAFLLMRWLYFAKAPAAPENNTGTGKGMTETS